MRKIKNILIITCLIQIYNHLVCVGQTKVIRGTTEEVPDSIIIRISPKNFEQFRSNSLIFFSKKKRLKIIAKHKFGTVLSFCIYVDKNGEFVSALTNKLNKVEQKVVQDYIGIIIKKTAWNLDTYVSYPTNTDKQLYLLWVNIHIRNDKKIRIGVTPSTSFHSPEYIIF
ncbi:hypothetical protein [Flectobacillus major]|uniref:hypothetical protein n=1 Tax=Flectobacillus major TaxID=103 RepID=UPI0005C57DD7|nr:hypothetical protein [Flectobacillus major]